MGRGGVVGGGGGIGGSGSGVPSWVLAEAMPVFELVWRPLRPLGLGRARIVLAWARRAVAGVRLLLLLLLLRLL